MTDQIDPNPYQPRTSMDLEALERLARGIKLKREQLPDTCGLMQVPMGRRVESGRVQLAFGHRRFEAFKHLYRIDGKAADWWKMPTQLVGLSDEEMYDFAARENGDREDINPIEKARSILEAQEKFGQVTPACICACGCGRQVTGQARYYDFSCRKRAQRKRDASRGGHRV